MKTVCAQTFYCVGQQYFTWRGLIAETLYPRAKGESSKLSYSPQTASTCSNARTGAQFMGLNIAKTGTYPFVEGKLLRIRIVKQPEVRSYGFLQRILHQGHSLYWLHKSYCPLFVPVLYLPMFPYMGLYLLFTVIACFSGLIYVEIVIVLLLLNEQALIDNGILQHVQYH